MVEYNPEAVQELVDIINTQKGQITALNEQVSALRAQSQSRSLGCRCTR